MKNRTTREPSHSFATAGTRCVWSNCNANYKLEQNSFGLSFLTTIISRHDRQLRPP